MRATRIGAGIAVAGCVLGVELAACGGADEREAATDPRPAPSGEVSEALEQRLRRILSRERGLPETVVDCAIDRLASSISESRIDAALSSRRARRELIDAGFAAGAACGDG